MKDVDCASSKNSRWSAWIVGGCLLLASLLANAGPVAIQNADFSAPGNTGFVGGLIGFPATNPVGNGPWSGTYAGVLGLLAAPTLSIGNGRATASGLLYTAIGSLNNSGRFHQTLGENVTPGFHYTLKADVDVGGLLSVSVLGNGNAGIAIGNGSTILASSRNGSPLIQLLSGTTYRVTLDYDAPAGVSGPLQAILLTEPSGVVTANLLTSVSFDNVSLYKHLTVQTPTVIQLVDPTAIVCHVGQPLEPGISIVVLDELGDPISGLSVSYSAPTSGASLSPATGTVVTNDLGIATFTPLANTIAGTYDVHVTVPSNGTTATLTLTNLPGPAAQFAALPGGTPSAVVGTAFAAPVGTRVLDQYGNGVPGGTVQFAAPASGASAGLASTTVVSDSTGIASVGAVANSVAGSYSVQVSVPATGAQGGIALINTAGPGTQVGPPGGVGGPIPSAIVTTAFTSPARALVVDQFGNPVQGVEVSFTAPASGASAVLSAPSALTDATGIASVGAVANTIAGSYGVAVSVPSTGAQSTIPLTNTAGQPAAVAAPSGATPQAIIGQPLSIPIAARVTDAFGNPVVGETVSFSAPASGASASLQSSTATTGANGIAQVNGTANLIAGDYVVTSSAGAVSGSIPVLNLLPATIDTTPDGAPEQTTDVNAIFQCLLLVRAVDTQGAPQPGLGVDFQAPASGPSATLVYGSSSGISLRVPTDADGFAWVEARGNAIAGIYSVTAQLAFSPTATVHSFRLRNLAAGDAAFTSGFDGLCARVGTTP